mmetsp:Transcript_30385/g.47008  ORF Transcript_30385/g.47008 Transcript_30385/m.47008 type:complete len:92 (+) Transcript_30385:139-414(+)
MCPSWTKIEMRRCPVCTSVFRRHGTCEDTMEGVQLKRTVRKKILEHNRREGISVDVVLPWSAVTKKGLDHSIRCLRSAHARERNTNCRPSP